MASARRSLPEPRRSRAWAGSDERALAALYVRRSSAARTDVRLLRSYTARGLVVRRIVTQVFGLRVQDGELVTMVESGWSVRSLPACLD